MENQSKIITISKVEMTSYESGNQYKITSSEGQKFKFYDKKKDGNQTVAFKQFGDMGLKIGSNCEVWYKEQEKEYEGKKYTDRIIASFREAAGRPVQTPTQPQKVSPEVVYSPTEPFKQRNFKQEGYEKCLWGYWVAKYPEKAFAARSADGTLGQAEMDLVWQVFNQIEADSAKRFSEKQGWQKAVEIFGGEETVPVPDDNNPDNWK